MPQCDNPVTAQLRARHPPDVDENPAAPMPTSNKDAAPRPTSNRDDALQSYSSPPSHPGASIVTGVSRTMGVYQASRSP